MHLENEVVIITSCWGPSRNRSVSSIFTVAGGMTAC